MPEGAQKVFPVLWSSPLVCRCWEEGNETPPPPGVIALVWLLYTSPSLRSHSPTCTPRNAPAAWHQVCSVHIAVVLKRNPPRPCLHLETGRQRRCTPASCQRHAVLQSGKWGLDGSERKGNRQHQACIRREDGVWNPKVSVPKIAQINISTCKFHFFPRRNLGPGGAPPLLLWLSAVLMHL